MIFVEAKGIKGQGMGLAQGRKARQNGLMVMESNRVEVLKLEKKYDF